MSDAASTSHLPDHLHHPQHQHHHHHHAGAPSLRHDVFNGAASSSSSSINAHDYASHISRTTGGGTSNVSSPAGSLLRHMDGTQPSTSTTPSSTTTPLGGGGGHAGIGGGGTGPSTPGADGGGGGTGTSSPNLANINPLTHPLYTSLFPPADLPIANISRIMKRSLPENAKIAKDAKECVQDCVSELISFVTSEASDKCAAEKRKTINGDDILYALRVLGFDNYEEVLKVYLSRYRMAQESNPRARKRSNKTGTGAGAGQDDAHDDDDEPDHDDTQTSGAHGQPSAYGGAPWPQHH